MYARPRIDSYKTNPKKLVAAQPTLGIWDLGFGICSLVSLPLLRLRLLLGDVLHRAGVRILQPLTPERVVDERIWPVRVLRLDVAQLQNAHVVRIRIAIEVAVHVQRNLNVGEILLEALDALQELGSSFDAVARAGTAEDETFVRLLVVVDGEL